MSNVIALPTAAPKKVRQCPSRTKAADWDALLQFPMERVIQPSPYTERLKDQARTMLELDSAAAIQAILAVYAVLPEDQRQRSLGRLVGLSALNQRGAKCALAWLKYEGASKGQKDEINWAASLVAQEAVQ